MGFFDGFGINSILSGIGGIADSILGHYESNRQMHFASDEAKAQREWSSLESQKNRDWQQQMYEQYNTPSAMMKQYKDANLNPFLLGSQSPPGSVMSVSPSQGSGHGASAPGAPASTRFADTFLNSLGVSSNVASQNAKTIQQEWETYQFIRYHVGRDAAKKFLDNHPELFQSNDPDNDPFIRKYNLSVIKDQIDNDRNQWELDLRRLYGVKQTEIELKKVDKFIEDLVSQISKRDADIREIDASIRKINEQIKTERSVQSRNYSESHLASAKAKTEDESRMYIIKQLLLNSGILERFDQTDATKFESMESLRGYLTSKEGKEAIARAVWLETGIQGDALLKAIYGILGNSSVSTSIPLK